MIADRRSKLRNSRILPASLIILFCAAALCNSSEAADPLIRQQKTVIVDGVEELWQLRWETQPEPICGADDPDTAMTCPCSGFAYGEQGKLSLVRSRPGGLHEELALGTFFADPNVSDHQDGASLVQRWQPVESGGDNDWKHARDKTFAANVHKRQPADVMNFADYDHDGNASEFLLQVATKPCGKRQMVLIGISKTNPHLHVFSTPEKPNSPLILGAWEWDALLKSNGHTTVIDWNCGDHGSDYQWKAILDAHDGVLHAKLRSFQCQADGTATKMIEGVDR